MTYRIDVSTANPSTDALNVLADSAEACDRPTVNKVARSFLASGYWVEVFDKDTGELLAGPFDPDQPAPSYIV